MTPDPMVEKVLLPCPFCGSQLSGLEHGVFGHDMGAPDCILSYTAFDASAIEQWNTRAALPELVELREAQAKVAKLEADWNEQSRWDEVVDSLGGLDQFDTLADEWIAREPIRNTIRAATSVFSKWANDELMGRYHAGIEAQIHLAFVEGAAAGARAALNHRSKQDG